MRFSSLIPIAALMLLATESRAAQTNVGYRVIELENGGGKTLTVAVWYPTAERPKPHVYGGSARGTVAIDAVPLAGSYPLLVFAHGYGGGGVSSVFFTEALAAQGWVVACPDHHDRDSLVRIRGGAVEDANRIRFLRNAKAIAAAGPEGRGKYLYRLDELKASLDGMLASELFGKLVDRSRIAVGGHSLGGFTALGLSGAVKGRHDPRIKALLLFSTGAGGYLYREEELAAVRVPSMLLMGENEADETRGSETMLDLSAKIYRSMPAPKHFLVVKGAGHFSFNDAFSDTRAARRISGTKAQFDVIRRYAIAFLEAHVAGRKAPLLGRKDPMLTRYDKTP